MKMVRNEMMWKNAAIKEARHFIEEAAMVIF